MALFRYPSFAATVTSSAGSPLSVRLSDGTSSYNTNTGAQLPATLGQKAMAASLAVVVASDQSALPVSQSGTWNVTNVSGTVSLPTGASTSANQATAIASLASIDTKLTSPLSVEAAQDGAWTVAATQSGAWSVSQTGTWTVDAVQSGTWNITNISGTVSLPTGASTAANQSTGNASLSSIDGKINKGRTAVAKATIDYTSTSVTTGAYVELISTVGGTEVNEIEIFDSSGEVLILATGAAASESDKVYILPGGNGRIPLQIASSTRVALKALTATASVGRIVVNFYS